MSNIKLLIAAMRKVNWKKLYSRNILFIDLVIIALVLGFFVGNAFANEDTKPKVSIPSQIQKIPEFKPSILQTTTTTTTTTVAPPSERNFPAEPTVTTTIAAQEVQGDWVAQCHIWATQAGIELPPAAIAIIQRESKCNPNAQNPASSACGIAQNIRGCNSPGYGYDPVQQLKWFHQYCFARYGSFEGAYQFWLSHHWY